MIDNKIIIEMKCKTRYFVIVLYLYWSMESLVKSNIRDAPYIKIFTEVDGYRAGVGSFWKSPSVEDK